MALHKRVPLGETRALELRLEAFNVFNHAQFYGAAAVNGNITSGSLGQIMSAAAPRLIQLATRFSFQGAGLLWCTLRRAAARFVSSS